MPRKVLAVYRGRMLDTRGTPIRVRSLLKQLAKDERIQLYTASWDEQLPFSKNHLKLTNQHLFDIRTLLQLVQKEKISVVIGHTTSASYYLAVLKLFAGTKLVLDMHGLEEEEARAYGDISYFRYQFLVHWHQIFYRMCDVITACSKSVAALIRPYNRHAVSLCGGVDVTKFNPQVEGTVIKKDNRIVLGYAGNTRIWQGVDFLVEVFQELKHEGTPVRLALLLSERKGLDGMDLRDVEIFGPVQNEEVPQVLAGCDILVIPRPDTPVTRISFPSKIPEHLAMGKPVIASNTGDADEVIEDGVNGLLYTPGDKEALKQKIKLLMHDPVLCRRLGYEAGNRAKQLSWETLGTRLIDLILKVR